MRNPATRSERFIAITALVLMFIPLLLFSSLEYRAAPLLAGCALAACWARFSFGGWGCRLFIAGLVLAQAASFVGGGMSGSSLWTGAGGLIGVTGLAGIIVVLLDPRWRRVEKLLGLGALVLLLAGSYAVYFISTERVLGVAYPEPLRLPLIWPTRGAMAWMGQITWEHTNYAGFFFALGFILTLERGLMGWRWWLLGVALGAGVFLTGSRSGWLMIAVSLPLVWIGRPRMFLIRSVLLIVASIMFGAVCLKVKTMTVPKADSTVHVSGLISRGSAGRTKAYQILWDDLKGNRTFGKGLSATGKPAAHLMHEHSIYLATLRGGGLVAVTGHLMVIAAAASAAWSLWRGGRRWPAVLLVSVLCGFLFDRSSVFKATGNYEFIAHWVAVLIPLVLTGQIQKAPARQSIASGAR